MNSTKSLALLRVLSTAALFCVVLFSDPAAAYPQFIFKGSGDCGSCHHSPTGGGFVNRWGREAMDVAIGEDWGLGWGNDDLAYDPEEPTTLAIDLGADVRLLPLYGSDADAPVGPVLIPMLMEFGGAVSIGPLTLYAGGTTRQTEDKLGATYGSREHWAMLDLSEGYTVRFGRMVLPFGLRQADHTQYVREDVELDTFDQAYGVEADFRSQQWTLSANFFAGDIVENLDELQERGMVFSATRYFLGGSSLGLSVLGGMRARRDRAAASVFGSLDLGHGAYGLAEVATQRISNRDTKQSLTSLSDYLRLGWFVTDPLDVYVELGHRTATGALALTKARAALGANWQLTHWLELAPQVSAESRDDVPNRYLAMAQLHFVY